MVLGIAGCNPSSSDSLNSTLNGSSGTSVLYVSSGSCYGGGVTTLTGSATVVAYNLDGSYNHMVVDYNALSPGDSPVGITEYDAYNLLIVVENTSGRRIDLVKKNGSGVSSYLFNSTALSAVLRSIVKLADTSLLVSKTSAIERFSSGKSRVTQSGNPYVNAPAGSCSTSTTMINGITASSTGKIIYTHAAATPNNRIGVIAAAGYAAAADCLSATTAPTTLAMPTDPLLHSSGKILVAYGSTTNASNFIYAYDYTDSTGVLSNATAAYTDSSIINGPSAMAEDTSTGNIYVSSATSTFNTIEKFTFNPTTKLLTRVGTLPFIAPQVFSRCVSDMKVLSQ